MGNEEKRGALGACTLYADVQTGKVGVKDSLSKGRLPQEDISRVNGYDL